MAGGKDLGVVGLAFLVSKDVCFSRTDRVLKAEGEEKGRQPVVGLSLAFAWTCFTGLAAIGAYVNVDLRSRSSCSVHCFLCVFINPDISMPILLSKTA